MADWPARPVVKHSGRLYLLSLHCALMAFSLASITLALWLTAELKGSAS